MVCEAAGVERAQTVVEFGAGTGAITGVLLELLKPGATFLPIEINPKFVKIIRSRFPDLNVVEGSATDTPDHLRAVGREHCDCIVSGLPWTTFKTSLQDALLDATLQSLRPGGRFATYMYLQSQVLPSGVRFKRRLRESFSVVGVTPIVWANLPPAMVFYGVK